MKKRIIGFVTLLFCLAASLNLHAQTPEEQTVPETTDEAIALFQAMTDTMSNETKEVIYEMIEKTIISAVDSIIEQGMYIQALQAIDTIQINWKKLTQMEPTLRMYMRKIQIFGAMEEWAKLVETSEECLKTHSSTMTDEACAHIYNWNGLGNSNLQKYKEALFSYEKTLAYYTKSGNVGNQANAICRIAYCYSKIEKKSTALSLYEKGFNKYLQYFNVTKDYLLNHTLSFTDPQKKLCLSDFSLNLFNMALFAQEIDDYAARKDYLKMSANCGWEPAKKEYDRIYSY